MTRKGFLGRVAGAIFGTMAVSKLTAQQTDVPPPDADQLARKAMIEDLAAAPRPDEIARKARSEAILKTRGVPVLGALPVIAGESRSHRRTDREVAERALAAMIAAVKAETGDYDMGQGLIRQFDAAGYLSPAERAFMADPDPDQSFRANIAWRYEGVYVLLWALGFHDELSAEDEIVDVAQMGALLRELGADGLFARAKLRPQAEILDMADYYYRLHWAVTNARLKGEALPAGTNASIMLERARALNWLYGYGGQTWDEVAADT